MTARLSLLWLLPVIVGCSAPLQTAARPQQPAITELPAPGSDSVWYFLDGQQITREDVAFIDRAWIASISHWVGAAARDRHGPGAREVVEILSNKKPATQPISATPLYLLDGREVSQALVRLLDTGRIRRIEVLKGGAAAPYGEKGRAGVVLIASKRAAD